MNDRTPPPHGRLWFFALLVAAAVVMLALRWHNLQVDRFSHYSQLAHDNQLAVLPVEPPRGLIYDRNGETLAINETVYSLHVVSDFAAKVLGNLDSLRQVIPVPDAVVQKLVEAKNSSTYSGVIALRERLDEQEITNFLDWQFLFPEIVLESELVRRYPFGDSTGHVIGHVGRLNEKDKQKLKSAGAADDYLGTKFIGKTGVELIYEKLLRGELGAQEAQVDAHGRINARALRKNPRRGADLYLTLDMRLQRLAESLLNGDAGAVVMMDVENGELLALASSPRFDVNKFVFGISTAHWRELNASEQKPLIHRAVYGQYAPGSTIKPFLALAALQNGWRDEKYIYHSRGFFRLGQHRFHDWKEGGHGRVDVARSIIRSVNTFYYELAHEIGMEKMFAGLSPFGFGVATGVDVDNEKGGVLPTPEWKEKVYDEEWFPGETVSAGVGQGYVQVTPLQMAVAAGMIANGGRKLRPYLRRGRAADAVNNDYSPAHLNLIRDAMAAVTRPGGTAPAVGQGAKYGIAGKTGTAQVSRLRYDSEGQRIKNDELPKKLRDHAWFVGYAPTENPRVAIVVMVENGGSGGKAAGPIARKMTDEYVSIYLPDATLPPPDSSPDSPIDSPPDSSPDSPIIAATVAVTVSQIEENDVRAR